MQGFIFLFVLNKIPISKHTFCIMLACSYMHEEEHSLLKKHFIFQTCLHKMWLAITMGE